MSARREEREEGERRKGGGKKKRKEKMQKGKKRKRKREKENRKGKREVKWGKRKGKRERGSECAPAATAAAVGHARRRSRVRGPGEVGHARRLRPSGAQVHAAGRRGRKEREKKRREIRGDDRDGR